MQALKFWKSHHVSQFYVGFSFFWIKKRESIININWRYVPNVYELYAILSVSLL